jgi:signal peptidase II
VNPLPRGPLALIGLLLLADQALKLWIKTHFAFGESVELLPWFHLHFTENPGMAFGMEWGGMTGKLVLSLFRLVAIGFIGWWGWKEWTSWKSTSEVSAQEPRFWSAPLLVYAIALLFAGALGNVLDSAFYGLIFDRGMTYMPLFESWVPYGGVATWGGGYAAPLLGNVVDMLYFPLIDSTWPDWVPVFGGDRLVFFRPIFNLADAAISVGVGLYVLSQWKKNPE